MHPKSTITALLALVVLACADYCSAQAQSPLIPTGNLSAFPTIVQAGTHPTLTWDITLPESVVDIVTITPPGTITTKKQLTMNVRVLGASVKVVWLDSRGRVTRWEWAPTEAQMKVNNGSYSRIFYNTQDNVNANQIVKSQTLSANTTINFAGRYRFDGSWSTLYNSTNSNNQVVALKDGDIPPTTTPLYQQPTLESFLIPYLDNQGKIKLGPRDVIYLMELTHTNKNDSGFDLQDLVLLVTFSE